MAGKTLSREDALQYLRRYPEHGRIAVAINIALVLAGNALVFWLLWSGLLRAAHLIVLVMVETALLFALGWWLQRQVPRKDWAEEPKPARERWSVGIFMLFWLGGAYGMTLLMVQGYGDLRALLTSPRAWIDAGLLWPLAYTAVLAVVHIVLDLAHYRRHGGPFQSTLAHDTMARVLTLVLGGIPFAMPFFVVVLGGLKGVEYVAKKAKVAPEQSLFASAAMLGVAWGSFALVDWLIHAGVTGWAVGFVFAKLISELMVACVPLVMGHVARHGP